MREYFFYSHGRKRTVGWGGWRTGEGDVFAFPILTALICLACVVIPSVLFILNYCSELFSSEIQELQNLTGLDHECKGVGEKKEINVTVKLY